MMIAHANRNHALLSASGAHRWLNCTPSAMLEKDYPDTTSDAAKEGTLAHELCEMKLRNYVYTTDYNKRKFNADVKRLKENPLWDNEMDRYTDVYLDYIKEKFLAFPSVPYVAIEKRLDLTAYIPDGFGTADCILICGGILQVIDFKYGKSPDGRVDAENNPQMMLYALGAYKAYAMLYQIHTVRLSIVQPRITDGISEWECSIEQLLTFGEYVIERANLAINGEGEFNPDVKTCRYCRVKGRCKARADENVKLVFAKDLNPKLLSNEQLGEFLSLGKDLSKWLGDVEDVALAECLAGREVRGWKAVEGRGSRDWTDMDTAFNTIVESGIDETVLWERKPLTLSQVEKVMGKKSFADIVGEYVVKKPGKPTLVESSDKRPSISNKVTAEQAFKMK